MLSISEKEKLFTASYFQNEFWESVGNLYHAWLTSNERPPRTTESDQSGPHGGIFVERATVHLADEKLERLPLKGAFSLIFLKEG